MATKKPRFTIRVGQIWQDKDTRDVGQVPRVVVRASESGEKALMRAAVVRDKAHGCVGPKEVTKVSLERLSRGAWRFIGTQGTPGPILLAGDMEPTNA